MVIVLSLFPMVIPTKSVIFLLFPYNTFWGVPWRRFDYFTLGRFKSSFDVAVSLVLGKIRYRKPGTSLEIREYWCHPLSDIFTASGVLSVKEVVDEIHTCTSCYHPCWVYRSRPRCLLSPVVFRKGFRLGPRFV